MEEEVIGDFLRIDPSAFLILMSLKLFPDIFPMQWKQCGATANFLASYFGTFFQASTGKEQAPRSYEIDAMSYILNELVENAVKFNEGGVVHVQVGLLDQELLFMVENEISRPTISTLKPKLLELVTQDPAELFLRRIEEKAENPDNDSSGLGFVTMMSDYKAKLGWKLSAAAPNSQKLTFSTMARVAVDRPKGSSSSEA